MNPSEKIFPVVLAMEDPFGLDMGIEPVDASDQPDRRVVDEHFEFQPAAREAADHVVNARIAAILGDDKLRDWTLQARQ